jgi:mono/diheme cytochrome c family protein
MAVDCDYNAAMIRLIRFFYPLVAAGLLLSQEAVVKPTAPKMTASISGKDLYREYCAVCHGVTGRGDGPAAHALKTVPTNLTRLAQVNGGRFPEAAFLASLRGERATLAHGSTEMPIWGSIFNKMSTSSELTQTRLHGLLNYVEEMQTK